jgi:hypothetical protein
MWVLNLILRRVFQANFGSRIAHNSYNGTSYSLTNHYPILVGLLFPILYVILLFGVLEPQSITKRLRR